MKIHVDQIPESGLELKESCDPLRLDLNRPDIKFVEPITVSARVTRGINNVSVELNIGAVMHLTCSRCLQEFTANLSKDVDLNIPVEQTEVIDLTDNLREEILLSYPLKALCRQDCKGLCANCGQDLNKGKCNCDCPAS
jgi:uncharacterized protein